LKRKLVFPASADPTESRLIASGAPWRPSTVPNLSATTALLRISPAALADLTFDVN
jgi:hypothetical protein